MSVTASNIKPKFDAETVIADFLADVEDTHDRVRLVVAGKQSYERWRVLAKILLDDLKEAGHTIRAG